MRPALQQWPFWSRGFRIPQVHSAEQGLTYSLDLWWPMVKCFAAAIDCGPLGVVVHRNEAMEWRSTGWHMV